MSNTPLDSLVLNRWYLFTDSVGSLPEGIPFQVKAISLPFVLGQFKGQDGDLLQTCVDFRRIRHFVPADPTYVKLWNIPILQEAPESIEDLMQDAAPDMVAFCSACHSELICYRMNDNGWLYECQTCGNTGNAVA